MINLPYPTQDEIDERFDLAVKLQKEYLLSEQGEMYPFKPDNLQEAIAEMQIDILALLPAYAHVANKSKKDSAKINFAEMFLKVANDYWDQCADKKAREVVQLNFNPLNMR